MRQGSTVASVLLASIAALALCPAGAVENGIAEYAIVGDSIPQPLDGLSGDSERGRRLVLDRETGNCLICHQVPVPREPSQGDLGPSLAGVGNRLSAGQLRLRLVDQSKLNPATIMPPYHRIEGLTRVAGKYRSKPVFSAQEIEDVVAWLATLKE
jgi:L-cysteine S-thiosulfotransferase